MFELFKFLFEQYTYLEDRINNEWSTLHQLIYHYISYIWNSQMGLNERSTLGPEKNQHVLIWIYNGQLVCGTN